MVPYILFGNNMAISTSFCRCNVLTGIARTEMTLKNKETILIAEDDSVIRRLVTTFLSNHGYVVLEASNGEEAIAHMECAAVDLIISDLRMPVIDGFQVLEKVRVEHPSTPVVIMSGVGTRDDVIRALRAGAYDYLTKPMETMDIFLHTVEKALERTKLLRSEKEFQEQLQIEVLEKTEDLRKREQELKKALVGVVEVIDALVEYRDPYTAGHERRVGELAQEIAAKMGMTTDLIEGVYLSGIVHDLGKVGVPSEILAKPGRLSDIEFQLVKTHPQIGFDILQKNKVQFPWPIEKLVHQHHERIDGSGYPLGLTGDQMLPGSRILAVADVVEAMASHRPYRPALGVAKALEEVKQFSGIYYDTDVVETCVELFEEDGYKFSFYSDR